MAVQGGQLLWNRMQLTLNVGAVDVDIDTVLQQPALGFDPGEPVLSGIEPVLPAPPGTLGVASRVMVVPLAPTAAWASVTHKEPFVDPATGTVHVLFSGPPGDAGQVTFNVLFWDPHTLIGPGLAHTYQVPAPPIPPV